MSNSRQTERLLCSSTRTRRRISAQFSMLMNTHRPHGSGTLAGDTHPHRGPQAMSKAMGAPFSDRPPVTGPRYVFSLAVTLCEHGHAQERSLLDQVLEVV